MIADPSCSAVKTSKVRKPYVKHILANDPALYGGSLCRLSAAGKVRWQLLVAREARWAFFCHKEGGVFRIIADMHILNLKFKLQRLLFLPSASTFSRIEVVDGEQFFLARAHIRNAFCGIRVPLQLSRMLSLLTYKPDTRHSTYRKHAYSTSHMDVSKSCRPPNGLVMEFAFCQSPASCTVKSVIGTPSCFADRLPGSEVTDSFHLTGFAYVDKYCALGTDTARVNYVFQNVNARFIETGLPVHGKCATAHQGEVVGPTFANNSFY